MIKLVDLVEKLARKHGEAVPLAELRAAAGIDETVLRDEILRLARARRVRLRMAARLVDADKIDRRWFVRSAGREVTHVSIVSIAHDESGLDVFGAEERRRPWHVRRAEENARRHARAELWRHVRNTVYRFTRYLGDPRGEMLRAFAPPPKTR